jgi:hypothetical protein
MLEISSNDIKIVINIVRIKIGLNWANFKLNLGRDDRDYEQR